MQNKLTILFFILLLPFSFGLQAQTQEGGDDVYVKPDGQFLPVDTVRVLDNAQQSDDSTSSEAVLLLPGDSVWTDGGKTVVADSAGTKEAFLPDPEKVVWLGAIIPGFGDIVNRKYWKLPIVYGCYMGAAFAITWTSTEYQFYKTAYRDIIDSDPTTNSHLEYLNNRGITLEQMGGEAAYRDKLKSYQDNYRRYRDISIIALVAVHGLSILWAYVDAQLYDFDISPDLSMRFQPTVINNDVVYAKEINHYDAFGQSRAFGHSNAVGIQWNIRIK